MKSQPDQNVLAEINNHWQFPDTRALFKLKQPAHNSRYELLTSYATNHKIASRFLRKMAKKLNTGFFNMTKLNPLVLDNQTGVGWNLKIRVQVKLKKLTALEAARIFPRSQDADAVIVQV